MKQKSMKAIRRGLGLRQLDLALKAGIGISTVSLIERGYVCRVSPELRAKIAKALRCEVEDVFPESETPDISRKKGQDAVK